MSAHSQAMRRQVHGRIKPMQAPALVERLVRFVTYPFRAYRKMQAEEARLARAMGEKPQPPARVGIVFVAALLVVLFALLIIADPEAVGVGVVL